MSFHSITVINLYIKYNRILWFSFNVFESVKPVIQNSLSEIIAIRQNNNLSAINCLR